MLSLVTFADRSMSRASSRLAREAKAMGVFDRIFVNDETTLDADFVAAAGSNLAIDKRGFGYWIWKPQVILQAMDQLQDGDVLLYLDAGCHLNPGGLARLEEYVEITKASDSGILAFQPDQMQNAAGQVTGNEAERFWAKGDVIDHFGVRENAEILDVPSFAAGVNFYRISPETRRFIKDWRDLGLTHFHLFDDSPSIAPDPPELIAYRHDQTVFGIAAKLFGADTVSVNEIFNTDPRTQQFNPAGMERFPIHVTRQRGITWWGRQVRSVRKKIARRRA